MLSCSGMLLKDGHPYRPVSGIYSSNPHACAADVADRYEGPGQVEDAPRRIRLPTLIVHCAPGCRISIDGHTEISFTEDVAARFVALGWHVQHVKDGNTDLAGLRAALDAAKKDPRPSFIKARARALRSPAADVQGMRRGGRA